MTICAQRDCKLHARKRAVIVMRHPRHPKPVYGEMTLFLCVKHAKEKTLEDVLTPSGWRRIVEEMMMKKLTPPMRELTTLEWRNIH